MSELTIKISDVAQYYWKKIKEQNPYLLVAGVVVVGYLTLKWTAVKFYRKTRGYIITGPVGLPFLGSALPFLRAPYATLMDIGSYGKLTTVQLGLNTNIFINDIALAKKILSNAAIGLHRPPFANPPHLMHFLALNGTEWQKRRKYFSNHLIGPLVKGDFTYHIMNKAFTADIAPILDTHIKSNQLWNPKKHCTFMALNLLMNAIYGINISLQDETGYVSKLLPVPEAWFVSITRVLILAACVKFNIGFIATMFTRNHNKLEQDAGDILVEFMQKYGAFEFDFKNDSLSRKMISNVNQSVSEKSYIDFLIQQTDLSATQIMADVALALISAGNTPTKAMEYGLYLLSQNADIQEEIYKELSNMKEDELVHGISKANILRAFVYEVLRLCVPQPIGIPHYASKNVVIDNYYIPKGAIVHPNLYYIHRKDNVNDNTVHLEYWLDENGKFKMNHQLFMMFSAGKRQCPGRPAALKILYYCFANIIRKYKLSSEEKHNPMKQIFGTVFVLESQLGIKLQKR